MPCTPRASLKLQFSALFADVSRKIPAISGHLVCMVFEFSSKLIYQHTSHFGTPGCIRRFIKVLRSNWVATLRSSSMFDADIDNRRSMIFPRSFAGEILEGRPVLSSSPEIETLLHTTALVLNRGMLVSYSGGIDNERPRGRGRRYLGYVRV